MTNKEIINKAADNIRLLSVSMVEKAKSGHPGGAMGGADFMNILYSEFLNWDPDDMKWANRDRFFLDPGHMSAMLYATLSLIGKYSMEELSGFRQWESPTPGHPEIDFMRGIENTSGPLGQGHTMAVGAAIAERFLAARFGEWMSHKIYTYISDGGIQEEISQGAGRIAGFLGLSNLIMFYDSNGIQLSTKTDQVTTEDTEKKYQAWGWNTITIEGNNPDEIREALKKANAEKNKPTLIIGKTIIGLGAVDANGNKFDNRTSIHGQPISAAGGSFEKTVVNLGGNPENPFLIFPEVKEYYKTILDQKRNTAKQKKTIQAQWEKENPELAAKLKNFLNNKLPDIKLEDVIHKENLPTRSSSGSLLGILAEKVENMIVASADLSDSDKTEVFLKKSKQLQKGDFSGAFLQAGVCELTMASICNGIAIHGGVIAACGTFFVFSDYMKPAIRLSALMQLPVKYIWTHDAFRVGEDGPTHQPIEQEAQIRLMEALKNHHGRRSMLVLRPADSAETNIAWKMAMENANTPTGLILSRQPIADLPVSTEGNNRYKEAEKASKGAYVVQTDPGKLDIILLANGSEVATLVAGAEKLRKEKGLKVRIVSAISEGLFRDQDASYQKVVIPDNVPVFGLTAGLPVNLQGLVGPKGKVWGMESFGYSAPFQVLDQKFGFTPDNVFEQVVKYLKEYK
jgi:transketolase